MNESKESKDAKKAKLRLLKKIIYLIYIYPQLLQMETIFIKCLGLLSFLIFVTDKSYWLLIKFLPNDPIYLPIVN